MIKFPQAISIATMLYSCALAQQIGSNDSGPTFRSRVELVTVPVVVRDKNGHSIGGLKKDDFKLFDKGQLQTISRFSIETSAQTETQGAAGNSGNTAGKTGAAPATVPTRFIAYVFDDVHAEASDLADARNATDKHIQQTLRPGDRVAVFTTSGVGMLDFTTDLQKIHDALFSLQPRSRQLGQTECPTMTSYQADLIENKHDQAALDVATDEAIVCSNNPDRNIARSLAKPAATRTLATGDMETNSTFRLLRDLVRRLAVAPGQRSMILAGLSNYGRLPL